VRRNTRRLHAVAAAVAIAGVLGTGAVATAATSAGGDGLTPYGPARVRVPYNRIYAFRVKCAAVPCKIRLNQHFYAGSHPLPRLRELLPGPIVMRQQPPPGQLFATLYTRADFNQSLLKADLAKYRRLTLKLSATMSDAVGGSASATRTITLVPAPLPVLIAGPYRGRRPSTIDISGDAGDIVTGLHWSSWTASSATGEGTSNVQNCVPDCASGTETPVPTSIRLLDPENGYFTKLVERRDGQTEVFFYTPGHLPDNWPGDAS
jgi:hypothetical protein